MIRFVDVRGQGLQSRFAFWDTVHDAFCTFGGSQAWTSLAEFESDFAYAGGMFSDGVSRSSVKRFANLCPDWVSDGNDDVDDGPDQSPAQERESQP